MLEETEHEYRRLLYVAMTRAADRLIIAGCMPGNRNNVREHSLYDLIARGLVTKDENLKAHLLAPEFFDAERYPEVGFTTTSVGGAGTQVAFEGEITIKGVTQPATLTGTITGPVTDPYGNERYGVSLETTVDRTAIGITWNAPMPDGTNALADEVTLKADLALVKAA